MARAIWSGAISFGLVMVPVKVYSAVSRKDVRFNQLHGADGGRIQQKRVCSIDGEEVPYEEIVKGYEIEPGRYVTITPAELDSVAAERTRRIEIEEFVALDDIDPIHWESTYYLAPDKTAGKPYALLLAALESTSRVGLGRVVLRSKEYLAAIRPARDALMLSTMLFADEIVPRAAVEEFGEEPAEVSPKELAIAEQLVGSLSADWDPDRYKDTYRERVLDLVKAKAAGREIVEHAEAEPAARVDDLMAALEASLAAATKQATAKKAPAKKAAAKPRRAAAPKKS
jgi:DNA end-binding protein Ku